MFTYSDDAKTVITGLTSNASNLTEIVIPKSVTTIYGTSSSDGAFRNNETLQKVTFEEGSQCTSIGSYAFWFCSSLTSITIPSGVTSIGNCEFYNCSSLTSITIPSGVTSIGDSAFNRCLKLETVTFEDGSQLTSINGCAFYHCSSLTSITIPANVTSIGDNAFYCCSKLKNVYYDGTIVDWCNITFDDDSYSNPMGYASHFYMKDENGEYQEVTDIVIPDTVTEIKSYAFYGFDNLTSVTIGKNVISIGGVAFSGCSSLTSITIPSGVTSIGSYAFQNCLKLTTVTFEDTSGWYVSTSSTATSGTKLTLTDTAQNATYLRSTYRDYYWKKSTT